MEMITLRKYQEQMIDDIAYEFQTKNKVCAVAPCGAGKTIMVGWMAGATALKNRRTLFLVHRQELIKQSSDTFTDMNILHGVSATKYPKDYNQLVQIGSVQTVARRLAEIPAPDLIIPDECHHATASTWKKIIEYYPNAKVLGVTATPERLGGHGLGDVFESLVIGPTVKELISWGNLSSYQYYAPPAKFDASEIRVKFGDYVRSDLEVQMDQGAVIGDIIDNYQKLANGMRAVCYCVSIAHSEHVAASFCKAGINAMHIDGETASNIREQAIQDFRDNKIKILCNVDLISEGFDVPAMEAVILARPTQSLTLHIQQAMRAMRPDKNNPNKIAIIIDHVGNVFKHGLPDEDRDWSLATKKKKRSGERTIILKQCPKCFSAHYPSSSCPYCGHVYAVAARDEMPKEQKGVLLKIEEIERKQKRQEIGRAKTIEELEMIAIKRGYSMRWVSHVAEAKGIK
ncbi:MAG: type restriction protein res subunit [Firmicutes bacterium]|nr:type restriction protein res subunit [Bacillota bacterium]